MRLEDCDQLGDAVFVRLTRRKHQPAQFTLVDREDFERIVRSNWSWQNGYAVATSDRYLAKHHMRLHAYVLKVLPGEIIDHISGDRLDNRRQNLRVVTRAENAKNARRPTFPGKTSRFKGVCWSRHDGLWLAQIKNDGVQNRIGLYGDEVDAARAYDEAALRLHKEFSRTNAVMKLFDMEDPFVPDCSGGIEGVRYGRRPGRGRRPRREDPHPMMPLHKFSNQLHRKRGYEERLTTSMKAVISRHEQ